VIQGKVSAERARERYGVVLGGEPLVVDEAATKRARADLRVAATAESGPPGASPSAATVASEAAR
jgi:hypothetical protein